MALIGSIAINAVVLTKGFATGITQMRASLFGLEKDAEKASGVISGLFATVAIGAATVATYKMVKSAVALGEQTDRARIVFGTFSDDVVKQANLMADAFGVSKSDFIAYASALGSIFKAAGFDASQAADLSVHFVKLATDLSSFAHIPVEDALFKIQSGLRGQVKPLSEVGVLLSEEAVKAYAAAHGIAKLGTELTDSQKIQARIGFITQSLADAHGNLALTADSAANAARGLMGRLENLGAQIGTALLPIVGAALNQLQVAVEALSMAWHDWTAGVVSDQVGVVGATGQTVEGLGWLSKAIGFVANAWQLMQISFQTSQFQITQGLAWIVQGFTEMVNVVSAGAQLILQAFAALAEHIPGVGDALNGALLGAANSLKTMTDQLNVFADTLQNTANNQAAELARALDAPWASDKVDAYFKDARKRIEAMRQEATKAGVDVTTLKPHSEAAAKSVGVQFAHATDVFSREGANALLKARFGGVGGKGDAADRTAKATERMVILMESLVGATGMAGIKGAVDARNAFMLGGAAVAGAF